MKYVFLAGLLLFTNLFKGYSQNTPQNINMSQENTVIEFEKLLHDFGTVTEGGSITHEFKFTNKGKNPLWITNVRASCGCTTPFWTSESIDPGKTGTITAQFNTINRPGPFTKTLTVYANTIPALTTLTITGNVVPKVKSPKEQFPKKVGNIRMFSDFVNIGKITTKAPVTREVTFYNDGTEPVSFSTHELPDFITVSIQPQTIGPKEKAQLKITYNALKRKELGPVEDKIVIIANNHSENKILLNLVTDISEYYPTLSSEDAANAPKVNMNVTSLDLGKIEPNMSTTGEVIITNTGKQDLVIKKVRSGASYILVQSENEVIKPGQTGKIKVTYNKSGKTGQDFQYVWIYSNDPLRPTESFSVKAFN